MLFNIQHILINSREVRIIFDVIYLLLPVLLVYSCLKENKVKSILAVCTGLFITVYNYFFSITSFVSIEILLAWMLIPFIFIARKTNNFYFNLHCIRILFILFFFSAALWKIRGGGIFNPVQMAGVLVSQHADLIIHKENWYTKLLQYLITNSKLSYALYFIAFLTELFFITGLFTRRFDNFLILLFLLFAVFNYFLMEINYFTWLPFMGCFYFSKYKLPALNLK